MSKSLLVRLNYTDFPNSHAIFVGYKKFPEKVQAGNQKGEHFLWERFTFLGEGKEKDKEKYWGK